MTNDNIVYQGIFVYKLYVLTLQMGTFHISKVIWLFHNSGHFLTATPFLESKWSLKINTNLINYTYSLFAKYINIFTTILIHNLFLKYSWLVWRFGAVYFVHSL